MSLIEVLTTVLIFSVGLLGLVGLQTRAIQVSAGAEDTNRAALLANELSSQMWLANDTRIDTTAWAAQVKDTLNGGLPNGVGTVAFDGNVATITVQWKSPNAAKDATPNQYQTQVVIK